MVAKSREIEAPAEDVWMCGSCVFRMLRVDKHTGKKETLMMCTNRTNIVRVDTPPGDQRNQSVDRKTITILTYNGLKLQGVSDKLN